MKAPQTCEICGAVLIDGKSCIDYFYQMLYWENEDPQNGEVHHLMVLSYYLQHPGLYSPDGLAYAKNLLIDFLVAGKEPQEVRRQKRDEVRSDLRDWKIKAKPGLQGSYEHPPQWTMTSADVVKAGIENYCASVRRWAQSVLDVLRISGNI